MSVGKLPQELTGLLKSTFYSRAEADNVALTGVGQATNGHVLTADGAGGAEWQSIADVTWPSGTTGYVWTKTATGAQWQATSSIEIGHASNSGSNTTNSTTYVDLPNGSLTMTLGGASDIVLTFSAVAYTSYASEYCFVRLLNNAGSQVGDEVKLATGMEGRAHSYTWKFSESSGGSKTWKIQYRAGYGGSRYATIAARTLTAWVKPQ